MTAVNTTASAPQTPELTPAGTDDRAVPPHARALAARLSALFEKDCGIVARLNDAQHRLREADERLWSGLAPDAFGLIYDGAAAAAIGTSPIAALIDHTPDTDGPGARTALLCALQDAHWQIHHGFCQYQSACEERRQLAFDVGELSQQLTQALCAPGWSAEQAHHANVHALAKAPA